MMLSLRRPLFWYFLAGVSSADSPIAHGCSDALNAPCVVPDEPISVVRPGSHYIVKLPCNDCLIRREISHGEGDANLFSFKEDNDLFFNITLSPDRTALLLNSKPMHPFLSKHPSKPPEIIASQISPNFTRTVFEVENSLGCDQGQCAVKCPWEKKDCGKVPDWASYGYLDYDYGVSQLSLDAPLDIVKWNITFDAIGGRGSGGDNWLFNGTDRPVIAIVLNGTRAVEEDNAPNPQAGATLFGPSGEKKKEAIYKLELVSVQLLPRGHPIPEPVGEKTFWQKIKHFFDTDVHLTKGHFVYFHDEWSEHGKKGTWRDQWAKFMDANWGAIFAIAGFTLLGITGLCTVYWLFFWIREQRRLAKWSGIHEIWSVLREYRGEEDGLLNGRYRDETDDDVIPPPPYTDGFHVNKPLPIPPSDKPLPAVPLLEDS